MKAIVRLAGVSLAVLGLCLFLAAQVVAAGPPIITQAESQVAVLSDGGLDVKYRLTFHETEPRSGITTMGPFDAGHRMLDYHIEHEGRETPIVGLEVYAPVAGRNEALRRGRDDGSAKAYSLVRGAGRHPTDLATIGVYISWPVLGQRRRYKLARRAMLDHKEAVR